MRFTDVTNDIAFRKIFGNEKKSAPLISFLNAALELEGDKRVASVTLVNPNLFPRLVGEKASILDVSATDQSGRKFVIEMQIAEKKGFAKRVQYYLARDYSLQMYKGDDYPLLNPAYFIGILDFEFSQSVHYHTRHLILDKASHEHLLQDMEFTFIELPKFLNSIDELKTPIDKWTYFIKHSEELSIIPDYANEDSGLIAAFFEADKYNWTVEELKAYDNMGIAETDQRMEIEAALEKGEKRGEKTGKEIKEKEAVIGFHQNGIPIAVIAKSLKISEELVQQIIDENTAG